MALLPDSLMAPPLVLRRWSEVDVDDAVAAIASSIAELRLWMDWAADGGPTVESQRAALGSAVSEFESDVGWQYWMHEAETDDLVGGCGLHVTSDPGLVEMNYWVRSDRCGLGYATAAAARLTSAAFDSLPDLRAIRLRMDRANAASARIPVKLGYRLAAEEPIPVLARGHTGHGMVWSMTRSAPQSRDGPA